LKPWFVRAVVVFNEIIKTPMAAEVVNGPLILTFVGKN